MRWNLDAKSCALGIAVGTGAALLIGRPGGGNSAVGQSMPVPAATKPSVSAVPQRFELRTWSTSTQSFGHHGAYLLDTQTGEVREIDESGNVNRRVAPKE